MPDQRSAERVASDLAPLPPRRDLLSADKEELIERLESLHQDLQRRMEVEEEILHLNLQKGTASLQSQVEEAARRFRAATQDLEAFRLEILRAEGDPVAAAPRPYIFEDLSSASSPAPDRSQLRSLLAAFRRLRDSRDRLGRDAEQAHVETARALVDLEHEKTAREKLGSELATLGVTVADLETAQARLHHEIDAAHTEAAQLRAELEREKFAGERSGADLERLRIERNDASALGAEVERLNDAVTTEKAARERAASEIAVLKIELTDAAVLRAEVERLNKALAAEMNAGEKTSTEISTLMGEVADLEDERDKLEKELGEARFRSERVREELEQSARVQERVIEETSVLRRSKSGMETEIERLRQSLAENETRIASLTEDHAHLGRTLAFEQARAEQVASEATQVREKLSENETLLAETVRRLKNPEAQNEGYTGLLKFLQKVRLKPLLDKNIKSAPVAGRLPATELLVEIVASAIGAQEQPLFGARDLEVQIVRPLKKPGLGELRQFVEALPAADLEGVKRVHDALRAAFFTLSKKQEYLAVDVDSLELVIGSRPRPAQSYWPLVCYVPELQEFWNGKLRTTTDGKPKELIDFLAESLNRAPASLDRSRMRLRMDSRFFNEQALRLLDLRKCSYVVAAPDSPDLRAAARACVFSDLEGGWEAAEWTPARGSRAFQPRYVVLRHPRGAQVTPSLPHLFRDAQSAYYVYAADRKITPWQALEFYAGRAASEETEHALMRDFCVNRLLARGPQAHATFIHLFLLSVDLVRWYRR